MSNSKSFLVVSTVVCYATFAAACFVNIGVLGLSLVGGVLVGIFGYKYIRRSSRDLFTTMAIGSAIVYWVIAVLIPETASYMMVVAALSLANQYVIFRKNSGLLA
jgi:hypothetical protein